MTRRRVLLVQPSIAPPGGGNAVACWMIEALKADHAITLLTRTQPDLAHANRMFGTSLGPTDLRVTVVPPPTLLGLARPIAGLALLRDHLLLARARRMAPAFDVVLTANNESDLGRRGIQYVHFPKFVTARPDRNLRGYQGAGPVRVYQAACALATGFSVSRMRANITLANSDWTGRKLRALHGIEPRTLHPPVAGMFPAVPWNDRRPSFASVGRIAPEKRLEEVIAVVAGVRTRHPGLTLHIAGHVDDRAYLARVREAARSAGEWVTIELDPPRERLLDLVSRSRFGIHGMHDEHFGMAVAELVAAGTIVFAHASGGPVEILGGDRRLLYENDVDAVEKIARVLADAGLAAELRASLGARAGRYSSARFVRDFRAIVDELGGPPDGTRVDA